jgi:hypothetical protein
MVNTTVNPMAIAQRANSAAWARSMSNAPLNQAGTGPNRLIAIAWPEIKSSSAD